MKILMPSRDRSHAEEVALEDLQSFLNLLWAHNDMFERETPHDFCLEASSAYCPACGDRRRMNIRILYSPLRIGQNQNIDFQEFMRHLIPSLYQFVCLQCKAEFVSLIHAAPDGPRLAFFSSYGSGIRTPNTPAGVAFYLDQAYRARAVGANSAAIAMYRGALEQLLFEQGFRKSMLGGNQ